MALGPTTDEQGHDGLAFHFRRRPVFAPLCTYTAHNALFEC